MINFRSTGARIGLFFGLVFAALATAVLLSAAAINKPWGVPDHRREEYDQIIRDLREETRAVEHAERQASAKAVIDETVFDFGFLDPETVEAEHDFVVRNEGEGDLVLTVAGSSCKCTVAKIEDRIVPPGQSRSIKMIWNVGDDVVDAYQQQATIKTNDPELEFIKLTVQGKVAAKWGVSPTGFTRLKAHLGKELIQSCFVFSQTLSDFLIVDASATGLVEVETEPATTVDLKRLQAKCGFKVRAKFRARENMHSFKETITLYLMDSASEEFKTIEIPFQGMVGQPLIFHGPDLDYSGYDLGTVDVNSTKEWSFIVRFRTETTEHDPYVSKIAPDALTATIEPIQRVASTYRVTIRLADDAQPARFYFDKQGYIEISDRSNPALKDWMPLFGQIIPVVNSD